VVAVSAFLINPVDEKSIVLPTDGFAPASDFDMYFLGRLHDVYKKPVSTSKANLAGGLLGPVGYIME
jgi:pilus assembly protein CpaC